MIDYSLFGGVAYDGCSTGHGSHVAGTIAGDQSYITGSTDYAGMAFGAKLTVQDVGRDGFLECLLGLVSVPSSLTAAFTASYDLGARIHSNSWGSSSNAYDTYAVNIDQFMWTHPEYLIVFANGNSGPSASTVGSPATAKNCISVGATQQAPNQSTVASYSSRGPASDGRYKPTIAAPGGDSNGYIFSVNNNTGNPPSATCAVQGSPFAGTSMATPAVAGSAALVREYFRRGFYPLGLDGGDPVAPTGALVKAVLVNCAADVATPDIPNNNEGFGRVLLDDALYFDGDTRELRTEMDAGVSTGGVQTFEYEIDSSAEPFEVALVWSDYPATSGASVALVNDLDLVVIAPGGAVYLGNRMSSGESTTGGTADRRNVEEMFRLNNPPTGIYTIEVHGFNVPQGPQPFALASTGAFGNWPENSADAPEDVVSANGWAITSAEPNPLSARTSITFRAPDAGARTRVAIYDLAGREIRTLADRVVAGSYTAVWDGRDDQGREAASGIYFARVSADGTELRAKLVLTR
ncbi:MAG: S8 family serine peptidase [Candidatus Eisenbacteria bacterium]